MRLFTHIRELIIALIVGNVGVRLIRHKRELN